MTGFTASKSRLFVISAMALYTEVVLIRWMSAEIRMFAYLKNFTLFACFLGLGLGMMSRRRRQAEKLLPILMAVMALALAFAPQLHLTRLFFPDTGIYQWGGNLHARRIRTRRRLRAILPGARDLLSDRHVGGRMPAGRRVSFASLHSEPGRQPGRHPCIYRAGVFFVAALGVDSAHICRLGLLLLTAHPRRTHFRKRSGDNRSGGDAQPRSVVTL